MNMAEAKAVELERLDAVQVQAWEAFEASQVEKRHTERQSPSGKTTIDTVRETAGNPRFLAVISNCVEKRCKILNLYEPSPIVQQPAPVDPCRHLVEDMTVEELRVLKRFLERPPSQPAGSEAAGSSSGSSEAQSGDGSPPI